MGHGWDFLSKLMDAKLEISHTADPVTNNYITNHYYIVEGDRIIQLTPDEFKRKVRNQKLIVENRIKRIRGNR